jgi:hypothetical protein
VQVLIDGKIALGGKIFPLREKWSGAPQTRYIAFYVTRADAVSSEGEATAVDHQALGFSMKAKSKNKEFKVTGMGAGVRLNMHRGRIALREVVPKEMAEVEGEDGDEDDSGDEEGL